MKRLLLAAILSIYCITSTGCGPSAYVVAQDIESRYPNCELTASYAYGTQVAFYVRLDDGTILRLVYEGEDKPFINQDIFPATK